MKNQNKNKSTAWNLKSFLESFIVSGFCEKFNIKRMAESHEPLVLQVPASAVESEPIKDQASSSTLPKETTGISSCLSVAKFKPRFKPQGY